MTNEQALVVHESAPVTVFGTDDPRGVVQRVVDIAEPLADFIRERSMSTKIQGRDYVLSEGWAFMGSMLGVFPVVMAVEDVRNPEGNLIGYEARVELRARDGSVVGAAIAECNRFENNWADRDDYALKSMAQTRAVGKAYRLSFGFVMKAAGYESTPAEEMGSGASEPRPAQAQTTVRTVTPPQGGSAEWSPILKEEMDRQGVTKERIAQHLHVLELRTSTVSGWLEDNPAANVRDLVTAAATDPSLPALPLPEGLA